MTTQPPEQSMRRVLWWARNFGRPLQAQFTASESETPDEFNQLLEMADKRVQDQGAGANER